MTNPEGRGREPLANDLLEGVGKIARFTGLKPRRVFYLAEGGRLPLFKIGNRWCARKSTLIEHIAKLERREATTEQKVARQNGAWGVGHLRRRSF